ncbi:extracellular solute-binding protein [Paenibacillus sepulcri]|uniref:Extracellular solute-binding protein n=1 Tax=Paenibacillus sepulcri TaxID=359917 RepID=A0ABS7C3Z2_9BACL|nr:extracellular solute-binding protein [Paenibacillus sepulcri]
MSKPTRWTAILTLVCIMLFVTACSSGNNKESSNTADGGNQATATDTETKNTDGTGNAGASEPEPYLGKFDPPIEISTVRIVNDTYKYPAGDSIESNVWTKTIEDKLGIKVKNQWVVSGDQAGGQGEQKMNVSIASGDLPDFIPVSSKQLQQLQDAGELMDLTEIYEKYGSPFLKEVLNQDGPNALASATFDGKLMAIPSTGSSMDGAAMVWIRSDWLKELNLPEPKTMQDILTISEAFTTQDPDKNGKDDTYGIALNKDLYGGFADITGFMNAYHAYPKSWIKDAEGSVVYGSIQPEMKTALAALQDLYKKGQIDKEFGVKDGGKEAELTASGKLGIEFGGMSNPLWPLVDTKKNDPTAEWQSYAVPSADDKPVTPQVGFAVGKYYAVKKDAKNPEALLKMMNLFVETGWGETTTPENYAAHFTSDGFEYHKFPPFVAWPARKNLDIHLHVSAALDSKDTSALNPEETDNYGKIVAFLNGSNEDPLGWAYDKVFGKTGSFVIINDYVNSDRLKMTEFYGAPTPAMVQKESNLQKRELEVFTKIIMGDPIDSFDKFVEDWKKLGGDEITAEVNEWAKNK